MKARLDKPAAVKILPENSREFFKAAIDARLDPELREDASDLDVDDRRSMADTFRKWANELDRSASQIEASEMIAADNSGLN